MHRLPLIRLFGCRKGLAVIVGSILFLVILLFFFTNVYLWHDQATRRMDSVVADKVNSIVEVRVGWDDSASTYVVNVTNRGGVGCVLSRLWIIRANGDHVYADLEDIEGLGGLWLSGGAMLQLKLDMAATGPYGSNVDVVWDGQFAVVGYRPSDGDVFRVLTSLGNTAADTVGNPVAGTVFWYTSELFSHALWCHLGDLASTFLNRIEVGQIDILVINSANMADNNTLVYDYDVASLQNFQSSVLAVNPDIKFFADIYSYGAGFEPNKTTTELRQQLTDEILEFISDFDGLFDGIVDDMENYVGTLANHWDGMTESAEEIEPIMPYFSWCHYNNIHLNNASRQFVGLYDNYTYP